MKKLIFSALLAVTVLSTTSASEPKVTKENKSTATTKAGQGKIADAFPKGLEVIHLDKEMFKTFVFDFETKKEWTYNGTIPAILDFYADWCGPCKMLAPHLEELQKKYKGKLQVYKINTDKNKELSAAFGIQSLPTIVFVPMTGQPQAAMGYRPLAELEKDAVAILKITK